MCNGKALQTQSCKKMNVKAKKPERYFDTSVTYKHDQHETLNRFLIALHKKLCRENAVRMFDIFLILKFTACDSAGWLLYIQNFNSNTTLNGTYVQCFKT
ncbi:CLUMA_CG014734, isoform A [Clunio marinus]|uniref:CLUMA_CG014734, isoform A n=1 Tax=Clunio marinus TaxID=568069 RepID=A0A1J1IMF3_9DIPT|nr:CLUMA_CG014734, isoform A [Clunio marinus]